MTHIAGGSRRGVPKVWILPVLALVIDPRRHLTGHPQPFRIGRPDRLVAGLAGVGGARFSFPRPTMGAGACLGVGGDPLGGGPRGVHHGPHPGMGGDAIRRDRSQRPAGRLGVDRGPIRPDRRSARGRVGPIGLPLRRGAGETWRGNRTTGRERATPGAQHRSRPRALARPGLVHVRRVGARSRRGADMESLPGWRDRSGSDRASASPLCRSMGKARRRWGRQRRTSW